MVCQLMFNKIHRKIRFKHKFKIQYKYFIAGLKERPDMKLKCDCEG